MARLSDHLRQLEETTKNESEAIERIYRNELETLRARLSAMHKDAADAIRSDMDRTRGEITREIRSWHEELSRGVIEAKRSSIRAALLKPVIVWAGILTVLGTATWYVTGDTRKAWTEYQTAKGEIERLEASRTTFEVDGKSYVRVDPAGVFQGTQTKNWYVPVVPGRDGKSYYAQIVGR
jgi:hypothetical protein